MGITIREFPERKRIRKPMVKVFQIGRWLLDEDPQGNLTAYDEVSGKSFILIEAPEPTNQEGDGS